MPPIIPFTITYDDEDLTEIESSDEEDPPPPPPTIPSPPSALPRAKSTRPSTQTATEKSRARGGLQTVAPTLKPYRSTTYSTYSLNEWIEGGLLDLDAEYQRGIVWNDAKQIGLIDSIFRNYYIPPIVFTVVQKDDGNEVRVCIDGKQRLTSIRRFILGEIPYKDVTTNRKAYFTSPPNARRKLISQAMQNLFKNKQITCSEYDSVTEEQEREIFQRVQMGMTLGPADRLPAINGPYADLVRGLRRRIENTEGFGAYHNWGEARGRDFQALTQIVYLMSHGTEPKKAEPTAMRLEAFLGQAGIDVSALEERANQVLDIFIRIAQDPVLSKPLEAELAPLEFVMAVYLVFTHRTLPDFHLSAAIYYMRQNFRKVSPDRKVNTKVFTSILNFVLGQVRKLKLDIPIDWPALDPSPQGGTKGNQAKTDPVKSSHPPIAKPATKSIGKRKSGERDGEDSDCDTIAPPKKRATPKRKVEAKPPAPGPSGSQAATAKAPPSRLKIESRAASKSKAKTTIKRASPEKQGARKPSLASSISSCITDQVAKPSVRPLQHTRTSLPPSRANSVGPGEPLSSGPSLTSLPPLLPTPTTAPPVPSSSNTRFLFPGRSTPANSPLIPASTSYYVSGQSNMINDGNATGNGPTPPRDLFGQDRLAPLRDAKSKRGSVGGVASSASLSTAGNGEGLHSASTVSTTSSARSKLPNFTKKGSITEPVPLSPVVFETVWNCPEILEAVGSGSLTRKPSISTFATSATTTTNALGPTYMGQPGPQPPPPPSGSKPSSTNKSLSQVLGVVQPPTRDPRPRPNSMRQSQTGQLPTPPQSSVSPQMPVQQPSTLSSHEIEGNRNTASVNTISSIAPQMVGSRPSSPKHIRPSAPYPGSGNQS